MAEEIRWRSRGKEQFWESETEHYMLEVFYISECNLFRWRIFEKTGGASDKEVKKGLSSREGLAKHTSSRIARKLEKAHI